MPHSRLKNKIYKFSWISLTGIQKISWQTRGIFFSLFLLRFHFLHSVNAESWHLANPDRTLPLQGMCTPRYPPPPRPSPASSFFFSNFLHNKSVTSGQRLILCLRSWDTGATKRARVIKVFVPITSEMMKGANNAVINGRPPPRPPPPRARESMLA